MPNYSGNRCCFFAQRHVSRETCCFDNLAVFHVKQKRWVRRRVHDAAFRFPALPANVTAPPCSRRYVAIPLDPLAEVGLPPAEPDVAFVRRLLHVQRTADLDPRAVAMHDRLPDSRDQSHALVWIIAGHL